MSEVEAQIHYYRYPERFQRSEARSARHIPISVKSCLSGKRAGGGAQAHRGHRPVAAAQADAFRRADGQALGVPHGHAGRLPGPGGPWNFYPTLEQALFSLAEGAVSEVVESELGYHLLDCDQIHPAGFVPVHVAVPQIQEKRLQCRRRICQRSWLAKLLDIETERLEYG